MKKFPAVLAILLLASAGFAAASIASGSNLLDVLTGTTATDGTTTAQGAPTTTGETQTEGGGGRTIVVCHLTGSRKHPSVTLTVSQNALKGVLRHGGHLGPCTSADTTPKSHGKPDSHGKGHDSQETTTTTTTTAATTTTSGEGDSSGSGDHGHGHGHGH